jgi:hypothetical protein
VQPTVLKYCDHVPSPVGYQYWCFVATGNSTIYDAQTAGKNTCRNVPFRDIAHAITAYALNQSSMYLQIPCPGTPNSYARDLEILVPNQWFRLMGMAMGVQINALPRAAWEAFQLHETQPLGTNTSFVAVFDRLIQDTTTRYLEETSASWPWTPPPPPPPPTPPPCPGGSLQVCPAPNTVSAACSLSPSEAPPPARPHARTPHSCTVLRAEPRRSSKHVLRHRRAQNCQRIPTKNA